MKRKNVRQNDGENGAGLETQMKSASARRTAKPENPPPEQDRRRWPEAALSIAVATAYAYLLSFLHQFGRATFYGYPPEYNSTSQQWVLFVASTLLLLFGGTWLSAMLLGQGLARSLHFVVVGSSRPREVRLRRTRILLLVTVVALLASLVWAMLTTPPFGRVVSIVFLVLGVALLGVWERLGSAVALKWGVVAAVSAMALVVLLGYGMAANTTSHYRVVGTNLLVLSIDDGGASCVVAPYDPATGVLFRRYSVIRSTESSSVVIDYVATGKLAVAPVR